ncbi:MAG: chitobiase/beta-hexosaminidase C-terminal domain-containing protein [Rhodopseudomonas palustris]|nr:chitobiase/beta-hexosaminidase C-terminal domain-containing protein [Rhodopseudomonas palustris]
MTFTPAAFLVPASTNAVLASATWGAKIAYTTDGSMPTFDPATQTVTHGTLYAAPFPLAPPFGDVTVNAVVFNWWESQPMATRTYRISGDATLVIDDRLPENVALSFSTLVTAGAPEADPDADGIIDIKYGSTQWTVTALAAPVPMAPLSWRWRMVHPDPGIGPVVLASQTTASLSVGNSSPSDCPFGSGPLPVGNHLAHRRADRRQRERLFLHPALRGVAVNKASRPYRPRAADRGGTGTGAARSAALVALAAFAIAASACRSPFDAIGGSPEKGSVRISMPRRPPAPSTRTPTRRGSTQRATS